MVKTYHMALPHIKGAVHGAYGGKHRYIQRLVLLKDTQKY